MREPIGVGVEPEFEGGQGSTAKDVIETGKGCCVILLVLTVMAVVALAIIEVLA